MNTIPRFSFFDSDVFSLDTFADEFARVAISKNQHLLEDFVHKLVWSVIPETWSYIDSDTVLTTSQLARLILDQDPFGPRTQDLDLALDCMWKTVFELDENWYSYPGDVGDSMRGDELITANPIENYPSGSPQRKLHDNCLSVIRLTSEAEKYGDFPKLKQLGNPTGRSAFITELDDTRIVLLRQNLIYRFKDAKGGKNKISSATDEALIRLGSVIDKLFVESFCKHSQNLENWTKLQTNSKAKKKGNSVERDRDRHLLAFIGHVITKDNPNKYKNEDYRAIADYIAGKSKSLNKFSVSPDLSKPVIELARELVDRHHGQKTGSAYVRHTLEQIGILPKAPPGRPPKDFDAYS